MKTKTRDTQINHLSSHCSIHYVELPDGVNRRIDVRQDDTVDLYINSKYAPCCGGHLEQITERRSGHNLTYTYLPEDIKRRLDVMTDDFVNLYINRYGLPFEAGLKKRNAAKA